MGSSYINSGIEDVVFAGIHYPGGVIANLHFSWLDPKKVRQLVVVGSQKMVVFDDMAGKGGLRIYNKSVSRDRVKHKIADTMDQFRRSIVEGEVMVPDIEASEPLKNECDAFVKWVLHRYSQPSTGYFGAKVTFLLEQISRSMEKRGKPVILEKEKQTGSNETKSIQI